MPRLLCALFICIGLLAPAAFGQTTEVPLGGIRQDSSAPVEVTADQLKVDQSSGRADFSGSVVIVQGNLKLSADAVQVIYLEGQGGTSGKIERMLATGNVLMVTPTEAAEAEAADYAVASSIIVMTGDVVLTQGQSALSGQKMTINLIDGTALVEGRVTTTLQAGGTAP